MRIFVGNSLCVASVVCEMILNIKRYLLDVFPIRKYSLFLNVKKSTVISCQGPSGMSLASIGWMACLALCCM